MTMEVPAPNALTRAEHAERINTAWNKSLEGILETSYHLLEAKEGEAALEPDEYQTLVAEDLHFHPGTAQRLVCIARDQRLTGSAHVQILPPSWGTLYEISRLSDPEFQAAIEGEVIKSDMERSDLTSWLRTRNRPKKLKAISAPKGQYNLILADPPWQWKPYSEKGSAKSAENHYETMDKQAIKGLPIAALAAPDAALFLWVHGGMINVALEVMDAWGFRYVSEWVWIKSKPGKGYWSRNKHEMLLIGTKGKIPAPEEGSRPESAQPAPTNRHSQKPILFHQLIEHAYPGLPKIELFARRERRGWDSWGDEVPWTHELFNNGEGET